MKGNADLKVIEKTKEENDELRAKLKKLQELVICSSHSPARMEAGKVGSLKSSKK